jgi:hypothetical protein
VFTVGGQFDHAHVGAGFNVRKDGDAIVADLVLNPDWSSERPGTRWGLAIEMSDLPEDAAPDMLSGRLRGVVLVHPDHAPWPECVFTVGGEGGEVTEEWSAPLRVGPANTGDVGRCLYMGCQSDGTVVLHAASGDVTVRVPLCKYHELFCQAVEVALSLMIEGLSTGDRRD